MKKISFTILDDYVSTEFLEQFGINADHEIIRVIEPILATDLDLDNESVYSFIENLRFDILGDLNSEIQCLGYEEEEWEDYFRAEYWERWILWSYPDVNKAKLYMTMTKGVLFMPHPEDFWFSNCR